MNIEKSEQDFFRNPYKNYFKSTVRALPSPMRKISPKENPMPRFAIAAACFFCLVSHSFGLDSLKIIGLWSANSVAGGKAIAEKGPGKNKDGSIITAAVFGGEVRTDSTGTKCVNLDPNDSMVLRHVGLYADTMEISVEFRVPQLGREYTLFSYRGFNIRLDSTGRIRGDGNLRSDTIVKANRWHIFNARIRWNPYVQPGPGVVGYNNVIISGYLDGIDVGQLHYPILTWSSQPDSVVTIGVNHAAADPRPYGLDIAQIGLYRNLTDDERLSFNGWEADPSVSARDTVYVPAIIYQILYDPPGDHSYASIAQGTTFSTSMTMSCENSVGASVTAGGGFTAGDFGASMEVTAGVEFTQKNSQETSIKITTQSEQRSDQTGDPEYMGPGQGDLVVYQSVAYLFRLYRRAKPGIIVPTAERDYEYFLGYRPLPSESQPIRYSSMTHFRSQFAAYPEFVKQIEALSAIDPVTHRIRPELKNSGKVTLQQVYEFSGYKSESWQSAQSKTFTYSWDLAVNLEMSMKVSYFASVEAKIKTSFTVGQTSSSGTEYTRTIGYEFADDESWDVFRMSQYLDRRFGVFLFEVDSARSYASWPFEDAYAGRSVNWHLSTPDTADTATAGDTLAFTINLKNLTTSNDPVLTQLTVKSAVGSFAHKATINAGAIMLPKDSTFSYVVKLTSPSAGTFPADIEFTFERPGDHDQFEVSVVRLYPTFLEEKHGIAITGDTMYLVPSSVSATVVREFSLKLKNIGERPINVTTGISDHSPGVVYEYTTFPNPVEAAGSRNVNVRLTATAAQLPCWVVFWAQAQEYTGIVQSVKLRIDTVSSGLQISTPAIGDTLTGDSTCSIRWSSVGAFDSLVLHFSYNGGVDWMRAATIPNTGSYVWKIPAAFPSSTGAIRLTAAKNDTISATVKPLVFTVRSGVVMRLQHRLRPGEVEFSPLSSGGLRISCGSPGVLKAYDCSGRLLKTLSVTGPSAFWNGGDDSGIKRFRGACLLSWESYGKRRVERMILIR
jgi:hypothetical protein